MRTLPLADRRLARLFVIVAFPLALLAPSTKAQSLLDGVVPIALQGEEIPDANGVPIPGARFGAFEQVEIDASGRVIFSATLESTTGPLGVTPRAYFMGTSASDLRMILRDGDPAPGLAPGVLLAAVINFGPVPHLSPVPSISSDGRTIFTSPLSGPGIEVNTLNQIGVFSGAPGDFDVYARQGDLAPGTSGALFALTGSVLETQVNQEGRAYLLTSLLPGTGNPPVVDASPTSNNWGIWSGFPGQSQLVMRAGQTHPSFPGDTVLANGTHEAFSYGQTQNQLNARGDLLYGLRLSPNDDLEPLWIYQDQLLMLYRPGQGSQLLLREGQAVPGRPSAVFTSEPGPLWRIRVAPQALSADGSVLLVTDTFEAGTRTKRVYRHKDGALTALASVGDPAPDTAANFSDFIDAHCVQSGEGRALIHGRMEGAGIVPGVNDEGLWIEEENGDLSLILQRNTTMPGAGGSVCSRIAWDPAPLPRVGFGLNDRGQAVFTCTLSGPGLNGRSVWSWDETLGLVPVLLPGDSFPAGSAGNLQAVDFLLGESTNSHADGSPIFLSHGGEMAMRVILEQNGSPDLQAVVTVRIPAAQAFSFCESEGPQVAGCGTCPCGNDGQAGLGGGCRNSNGTGATLVASGQAVAGQDTLRFEVQGAVPASFGVLLSATNQLPAAGPCGQGSGIQAFDGFRCIGGALQRHGTRATDSGDGSIGTTNPGWGGLDLPVAGLVASGGFASGQTRNFQCFYRDDIALSCFGGINTTNGVEVLVR